MYVLMWSALFTAIKNVLPTAYLYEHQEPIGRVPVFETGPEGPELEDYQVEKKSKAAQTRPKKLIRRTCPSGHGSDGNGPKWHAPPCSESGALSH